MRYRRMALAGALLALSGWAAAQSPDALQARAMAATCAGCHGTHGQDESGLAFLAGVPQAQLLQKMLDFKTGAKPATLMHQISRGYSDEQLRAIAGYFSLQKK